MEEYLKLKELFFNSNERVCDFPFIDIKGHNARVYYKPKEDDGMGFVFYAVEIVGYVNNEETMDDKWHPDYTSISCVYSGRGFFDGIRHLYIGDEATDSVGYLYCPNIQTNIEILKVIDELGNKYCRDYND